MIYVDTSVIVKLYIKEKYSRKVSKWLRENNEAIPLTNFHALEFANALHLKQFRREISSNQLRHVLTKFNDHQEIGVYYHPQTDWSGTLRYALDLAQKYTTQTGSRTLDIFHLASAVALQAKRFLTLDERQSKPALSAGLQIENFMK